MPITPLPTPPSRNDPTTFADRGDALLGALPTFVTEANALETAVEADKDAAASSAAAAYDSATAAAESATEADTVGSAHVAAALGHANNAAASANFKGAWSSLTGALSKPASVSHNGLVWLLLNDLADVTTSEPGVSADWERFVVVHYDEFTSSGTWTKPDGVTVVYAECVGGGGSGGAAQNTRSDYNITAEGGWGGSFTGAFIPAESISASVVVTIGAGGAAAAAPAVSSAEQISESAPGETGGESSFGGHLTAPGGKGGKVKAGISSVAGPAQTAAFLETEVVDNAGQAGQFSVTARRSPTYSGGWGGTASDNSGGVRISGSGYSSVLSGNGGNAVARREDSPSAAQNGGYPGGGGGGITNYKSGGPLSGATSGAGAAGRVRVWAW